MVAAESGIFETLIRKGVVPAESPEVNFGNDYPEVIRSLSEVLRQEKSRDMRKMFSGAVSIERLEGSRWRLRRRRGSMGFESAFFAGMIVAEDQRTANTF